MAAERGARSGESPATGGIRTVFSVDGSPYHRWQAELLAWSHRAVGQPGSLHRLYSGRGEPPPFPGATTRADPHSPHPATRDRYPPYNKPAALLTWLREVCPPEPTILLLDPDCVFVAPLTTTVAADAPIAQPVSYLRPGGQPDLVRRHCRRPERVQPIGIPTLVHRDDLAALASVWLAKTEEIRADPRSREAAGWVAEMWGYAFAAAELGLRHRLRPLAAFPTEDRADLPIVHYCYASVGDGGRWRWDKRRYAPWEPVVGVPPDLPRAARDLLRVLNACAAARGTCPAPGTAR